MKKMNKKGVLDQIGALGIGIVTLAVVLTVGFLIMASARTQIPTIQGVQGCINSTACNATETLIEATATIPGWISIVVIAAIGAILLGLVMMYKRR